MGTHASYNIFSRLQNNRRFNISFHILRTLLHRVMFISHESHAIQKDTWKFQCGFHYIQPVQTTFSFVYCRSFEVHMFVSFWSIKSRRIHTVPVYFEAVKCFDCSFCVYSHQHFWKYMPSSQVNMHELQHIIRYLPKMNYHFNKTKKIIHFIIFCSPIFLVLRFKKNWTLLIFVEFVQFISSIHQ